MPDKWTRKLNKRKELKLKPKKKIGIKRDVHNAIIKTDAKAFITAMSDVLRDPSRTFGLITIRRPEARIGKPWIVGDRLQGRYDLAASLGIKDKNKNKQNIFEKLFRAIENTALSDYGLVTEVILDPADAPDGIARFTYTYLKGTPIAGYTTFQVEPLGPNRCRYTSIFVYQELELSTVLLFGSTGLIMHNQVILSEIDQACELLGVEIESMDIPTEYRDKI